MKAYPLTNYSIRLSVPLFSQFLMAREQQGTHTVCPLYRTLCTLNLHLVDIFLNLFSAYAEIVIFVHSSIPSQCHNFHFMLCYLFSSQLVFNMTFALSWVLMGHLLKMSYNGQSSHIACYICRKFWEFSTLLCSFQDLNRTYDINKSAQKRLHEVESLTAYRYRNLSIFTMFFFKLEARSKEISATKNQECKTRMFPLWHNFNKGPKLDPRQCTYQVRSRLEQQP